MGVEQRELADIGSVSARHHGHGDLVERDRRSQLIDGLRHPLDRLGDQLGRGREVEPREAGAAGAELRPGAERDAAALEEGRARVVAEPERAAVEPGEVAGLPDARSRPAAGARRADRRAGGGWSRGPRSPRRSHASRRRSRQRPRRGRRSGRSAWRSRAARATWAAAVSEAVTAIAHFRPAVLNAFEAEVRTMPRSAAASETVVNGMCSAPGKTIGAWISSASTQPSCAAAISAIRVKLVAPEHGARRVVRVAEDQHAVRRRRTRPRSRRGRARAHRQAAPRPPGRPVSVDHREERVVDGRVDDHAVARLGQHADEVVEARDDVVERRHLRGIDLPPEAAAARTRRTRARAQPRRDSSSRRRRSRPRAAAPRESRARAGSPSRRPRPGRTSSGYQVHLALRRARRLVE